MIGDPPGERINRAAISRVATGGIDLVHSHLDPVQSPRCVRSAEQPAPTRDYDQPSRPSGRSYPSCCCCWTSSAPEVSPGQTRSPFPLESAAGCTAPRPRPEKCGKISRGSEGSENDSPNDLDGHTPRFSPSCRSSWHSRRSCLPRRSRWSRRVPTPPRWTSAVVSTRSWSWRTYLWWSRFP